MPGHGQFGSSAASSSVSPFLQQELLIESAENSLAAWFRGVGNSCVRCNEASGKSANSR